MNADARIAPLVPFIQAFGMGFEGLDAWMEEARIKIQVNRKLVDAYAAGGDVVQTRLSLRREDP
jgi:hypothetical protein